MRSFSSLALVALLAVALAGPPAWAQCRSCGRGGGCGMGGPMMGGCSMGGCSMGGCSMGGCSMGGPMLGGCSMGSCAMGSPVMGGYLVGAPVLGGCGVQGCAAGCPGCACGAAGCGVVLPARQVEQTASIIVDLPEEVQVEIDGQPTKSKGRQRRYTTPPLPNGREYHYTFAFSRPGRGKAEPITRKVPVRAGGVVRVLVVDGADRPPREVVGR